MVEVAVAGFDPKTQVLRVTCISCHAQFRFTADEVVRSHDGGTIRCSIPCPEHRCGRMVRWEERQQAPQVEGAAHKATMTAIERMAEDAKFDLMVAQTGARLDKKRLA